MKLRYYKTMFTEVCNCACKCTAAGMWGGWGLGFQEVEEGVAETLRAPSLPAARLARRDSGLNYE